MCSSDRLEDGEVSIHDDRHASQPWGILGGKPGACSEKWLVRADGEREPLPSKVDHVQVRAGDRIVFRTAGGGGWGDPLERDPRKVRNDVARKLLTADAAREHYGVVVTGEPFDIDAHATEDLRGELKAGRAPAGLFDFGARPGEAGVKLAS